jgi:TatD DNase family protein
VHCHLNFGEFDTDRDLVVNRASENGVIRILIPGIDIETSKTAIKYAHDFPQVYAAVGMHPNSGLKWTKNSLNEIRQLAGEKKVVAIGEIGLDYYRDHSPRDLQRSIFIQQLGLAAELGIPVIIHNRNASKDISDILQDWHRDLLKNKSKLAGHPGELHSFSGTLEFAEEMTALDFKIGITGPVTFRNSQSLHVVVRLIPLEQLLIETDAPYLSPHPFRGKRNEPANVRIVADKIAELKELSVEQVAKSTTEEADKLFNWRETH